MRRTLIAITTALLVIPRLHPDIGSAYSQTTYYLSTSGSDANNGKSPATPWRTLDKVAFAILNAGDQVLLKRGDRFDGALVISLNGSTSSPAVVGAYGVGPKPVIYGDLTSRTWLPVPGKPGVYKMFTGYFIPEVGVEYYSGAWHTITAYPGQVYQANADSMNAFLSRLAPAMYGPAGGTDTVWYRTYDGAAPRGWGSLRFIGHGNALWAGSHDGVIRDLELRNCYYGLDLTNNTNVTVRGLSIRSVYGLGIYLKANDQNVLVDSCDTDTTGSTALYSRLSRNTKFRYNQVSDVVDPSTNPINGLPIGGGDMCGIGLESDVNSVAEYNTISRVVGSAFDYYYTSGDTVRYNRTFSTNKGANPHGTGNVLLGNVFIMPSTGSPGGNCVELGPGTTSIINNIFINCLDFGIIGTASGGGRLIISGNQVGGLDAATRLMILTTNGISSNNNVFSTIGVYSIYPTIYYSLTTFQAAAGLESGSIVSSAIPMVSFAPLTGTPPSAATNVSTNPTLTWNTSAGATSYRLQVSTSSSFSPLIYDQAGLTSTSQALSGLTNGTQYYWRVNATNAAGTSGWSAVSNFTTSPQLPPIPAVPLLSSPPSGSPGISINPVLVWNSSAGAATYRLQVSTYSNFSMTVFDQINLTASSQLAIGLAYSTTYYWRVNASNAGGTSGWSPLSSFSTISSPTAIPSTPLLNLPGNGAIDLSVNPSLSWSASSGATMYHVQLSTSPDFSAVVYDQSNSLGVSVAISGLANSMLYYWHVNATNAGGTSDWSPSWSFTTTALPPVAPSAPLLSLPINSATRVSANPTLTWMASSGAASYRLQVSTSSTFLTTIYDQSGLAGTTQAIGGLAYSTTYFWRVNATNAGGTGGWSQVWAFSTIAAAPPTIPVLSSPANRDTAVSVSPTLIWNSSVGVTTYQLQVSAIPDFVVPVYDQGGLTGLSQTLAGLSLGAVYYWRVNAVNVSGPSGWSDTWSFTTMPAPPPIPPAPALSKPDSGAAGVTTSPSMTWSPSAGATTYRLQVSTSPGFSSTVYDQGNLSGTTQMPGSLANGTIYYWRVNATNVSGSSAWSQIWTFTTTLVLPPVPSIPVLTWPSAGASGVPLNQTLSWSFSTGAASYELQVSTIATFSTTVFDQSNLTATSQAMSALANGTQYYWRVNATNAGGTCGWSQVWNFTTAFPPPPIPSAPALLSPASAATGVAINPTMSWNASAGALTYRLQVSMMPDFSTTVFDQASLGGTSQAVSGLAYGTQYYWRANAANTTGTSGWSNAWSFTTLAAPPVPAVPVLSSPANGAPNISTNPSVSWNPSTGAASYRLQVSSVSDFSSTFFDQSSLTVTSQSLVGLVNSTLYYWRVNAANAGGTSGWSTAWNFTTTALPPPAPPTPILRSPPHGSVGNQVPVTLQWNVDAGAVSYRLQVSTSSTFASTVYDQANLSATSQSVSTLANYTQYYWRVNASNAGGTSGWTDARMFVTGGPLPPSPSRPALTSPDSGATNVSIYNPMVIWAPANYAETYEVQVATSPAFLNVVYDQAYVRDTTQRVGGLSFSTQYYWRVKATNIADTSAWSVIWTFSTPPTAPPAPSLSFVANGTTGASAKLTLMWNASAGATSYRLQVSPTPTFSATVYDQSGLTRTSQAVVGLSNLTVYYWRVSATNPGGTSPWSPVWSFTTAPPPPAPSLSSPASGTTNASVTPELRWNDAVAAESYHLQVASTSDFATIVYDEGSLTSTSRTITPLDNLKQYFWHVSADNPIGTSSWSQAWSFTTAPKPYAPLLSLPASGSIAVSLPAVLSWSASAQALSYQIQVSTTSDFQLTVFDRSNLMGTSQQIDGLAYSTLHYWRLNVTTPGGTSAWSQVWSFSTAAPAPPTIPVLSSPTAGATGVSINPTLTWNASDRAASYRLQVSPNSSYAPTIFDQDNLTSTSQGLSGLSYLTTYYWRVSASNSGGSNGWSQGWSFTTAATPVTAPSIPGLGKPDSGATRIAVSLTLSWNVAPGAATYQLQVSTNPSFSTNIFDQSGLMVTSMPISGLTNFTVYYWRVSATNAVGSSNWSPVWSFTTIPLPPLPPLLNSPTNGAAGISQSPTLSWGAAAGPASYHFQLAETEAFNPVLVDDSTLTVVSKTLTDPLALGTTYYWRVRAKNDGGYGSFSAVWHFMTIQTTSVQRIGDEIPKDFGLSQNYPNPFNPATAIPFAVPATSRVSLKVYDLLGRLMATLVSQELTPGFYIVGWQARVASGVYIYRFEAENTSTGSMHKFVASRKMIVTK